MDNHEWTIMNGQSSETGNNGAQDRRRRQTTTKRTPRYVLDTTIRKQTQIM